MPKKPIIFLVFTLFESDTLHQRSPLDGRNQNFFSWRVIYRFTRNWSAPKKIRKRLRKMLKERHFWTPKNSCPQRRTSNRARGKVLFFVSTVLLLFCILYFFYLKSFSYRLRIENFFIFVWWLYFFSQYIDTYYIIVLCFFQIFLLLANKNIFAYFWKRR